MYDVANKIIDNNNFLKIINRQHNEIHDGDYYSCLLSTTSAAASTVIMYIKTPDTTTRIHFTAQANSSVNNITCYFANASVAATSSYTVLTAYNKNFNSTKTTSVIFGMMPSSDGFSTYGGTIYERWALQGSVYDGAIGGKNGHDNEWILQQNTGYVLNVISLTTSAVNIHARIYEV